MTCAGVYVHIPFCQSKCAYCDFVSFAGLESLGASYVDALCREIAQRASAWASARFDTLFIGGGTPTVLPPEQIVRILSSCFANLNLAQDSEVTSEANPGTVSLSDLHALRTAGVNRLSLGVQSLCDKELQLLGRIHTADQAVDAYRMARQAGFDNINLDLIYGLPEQPVKRWLETLERTLELYPEHLSLYALTIEAGTPLAERIACGDLPKPDNDQVADMYELSETLLQQAGYVHYEISNWARDAGARPESCVPTFACRHNLKYWRNQPYLGVGAAAHSYDGQFRIANTPDPQDYIARIAAGQETIVQRETVDRACCMGETMMLGLRLIGGVRWDEFAERFGVSLRSVYGQEIDELITEGLLEADARGVRLTPRGRLLGNLAFAAFLRADD